MPLEKLSIFTFAWWVRVRVVAAQLTLVVVVMREVLAEILLLELVCSRQQVVPLVPTLEQVAQAGLSL